MIELLIVSVILGLLAVIAIPTFLGTRRHAWEAEASSTVRNTATALTTLLGAEGLPDSQAAFDALGLNDHDTLTLSYTSAPSGQDFCLAADHDRLEAADDPVWASGVMTAGGACPPGFGVAAP